MWLTEERGCVILKIFLFQSKFQLPHFFSDLLLTLVEYWTDIFSPSTFWHFKHVFLNSLGATGLKENIFCTSNLTLK